MAHVFVSYNQADGDFAELLTLTLKNAGIETWIDRTHLRAGEDWSEEIDAGIRSAFALIVVMSPDAKQSEYVTYEWSFALGNGIIVIPVMVRKTELHPRLNRIQFLDFTHSKSRPWERLIERINALPKLFEFKIPANFPTYLRNAVEKLDSTNRDEVMGAMSALVEAHHDTCAILIVEEALRHPSKLTRNAAAVQIAANVGPIEYILDHATEFDLSEFLWEIVHQHPRWFIEEIYNAAKRNQWERNGKLVHLCDEFMVGAINADFDTEKERLRALEIYNLYESEFLTAHPK